MTIATVVPFRFESHEVRTLTINGEPWFVAKDVCDILGYVTVTDPLRKIPATHKDVTPIDTSGGVQKMSIVDEPGLYRLILRSDKPQAEPFMEWVTAEVLPTIRKTGSYEQPEMQKQKKPKSFAPIEKEYRLALRAAKSSGLKGKQAVIAADLVAERVTGFSPLDMMGVSPADLPGQDHKKQGKELSSDASLTGMASKYLDMLEVEWTEGRTRIQFTEKEDGRLEAVITMRDLFADFQDIACRYSLPQYRSTMQLALRCSNELDLLKKQGWTLEKTVKITGIQRWLLVRQSDKSDSKYLSETPTPLLSGEIFGEYESAPAWH